MAHDPRWKFPQAKTPEAMWDWAFNLVKELRAGTYLPSTPDADDIAYSNTTSGLTATDVQAAIDENAGAIGDLQDVLGLALLGSGTLSDDATLDIDISGFTAYRALKFVLTDVVPATDNVALYMRTSADGSTFDAGASDYAWGKAFLVGTSGGLVGDEGDNADSEIELTGAVGNGTGEATHGEITLYSPSGSKTKVVRSDIYKHQADGNIANDQVVGARLSTGAIDAVRFLFSTGNIASGSWAVYGYA